MPIFIGDMAQRQRLVRGISAVQYPSQQVTCKRKVFRGIRLVATHTDETLDQADFAVHTASRVRHQQQFDHYPRVSDQQTQILDHFQTILKCISFHCRGAGVPHSAAHPAVLAAHLLHLTRPNKCVCTSLQRARRTLQRGRSTAGKQQPQQQ